MNMREGLKQELLYLNNSTRELGGAENFGSANDLFDIRDYWAYENRFPDESEEFAGVFISGSPHSSYDKDPWIKKEHRLITHFANRGVPMFGICFGSQILASALCGQDQVYRRSECEVGFKWLTVSDDARYDLVCNELEKSIRMFVWHNDDVKAEHSDICVLASSDVCSNQIWSHRTLPVWGVQGHLEITAKEAPIWFERNRSRLEADGADVDGLIADAEDAMASKTMFQNFLDYCVNRQEVTKENFGTT